MWRIGSNILFSQFQVDCSLIKNVDKKVRPWYDPNQKKEGTENLAVSKLSDSPYNKPSWKLVPRKKHLELSWKLVNKHNEPSQ